MSSSRNPAPKKDHRERLSLLENIWIFLEDAFLNHSPSRKQMNVFQELKTLEVLHDFIVKLGSALKVDSPAIFSATVYVGRFYMRMSITTSKYFVASASMVIANKLHDNYRPLDRTAMLAARLKNPDMQVDEQSDIFWNWRDQLLYREELILKNLNFDLNCDLPYGIRDSLMQINFEVDGGKHAFESLKDDIFKNTIRLIEMLTALPILLAYDIYVLFGAVIVVVVCKMKESSSEQHLELKLPSRFLSSYLHVDIEMSYKCYHYIQLLLKHSESSDPRVTCHTHIRRAFKSMDRSTFYDIANEH